MDETRRDPDGEQPPVQPWQPPLMPGDSQRIGLDRSVPEGAWLEFASMLDRRKRSHVAVALLLLAVFLLPVFTTLRYLLWSL
jgi:hypothetical protein